MDYTTTTEDYSSPTKKIGDYGYCNKLTTCDVNAMKLNKDKLIVVNIIYYTL